MCLNKITKLLKMYVVCIICYKNYKQIYTLKNIRYIIFCFKFTTTKNNNYCKKIQKKKIKLYALFYAQMR